METFKYKGFISYSHDDERWGSWLHRKLETFRFPRRTVGRETKRGIVPRRFTPVFRDRDELTAGANLGAEIQDSLRQSENLIVLCSPRSAQSYWVNKEIQYFKQHNNPDNIFAFIMEGEPFAQNPEEECFPEALKYAMGADGELSDTVVEPLAADARDVGDGKSLALLKILSGMAGLGLDELVQRDLQRARRRVTGITATALTTVLIMGSLTWYAWEARQEADTRRADAEGLIEFMLTDLRDKLEPVGKLDILDAVGQEATGYYDSYDAANMSADAIGRRATAYHLLGDIQLRMGKYEEAQNYFEPAFDYTEAQLKADPDNPDRIYEHIQSVFWKAQPLRPQKRYDEMLKASQLYSELAEKLYQIEGDTDRSVVERAWGWSNIGDAYFKLGEIDTALSYAEQAIPLFQNYVKRKPTPTAYIALARAYDDRSNYYYRADKFDIGFKWEKDGAAVLNEALALFPDDYQILKELIRTDYGIGVYLIESEKFDDAKNILLGNLENIEKALKIEPNNNRVLINRLSTHENLVKIGTKTKDNLLAETHLARLNSLIEERMGQSSGYEFDPEWDYQKPRIFVRRKLSHAFSQSDFEVGLEVLPLLKTIVERLDGRPGFEKDYIIQNGYYLLSKSFLTDDVEAYRSFVEFVDANEKGQLLSSFMPMMTFMGHKFCLENRECRLPDYTLTEDDFASPHFTYFQQKYPKFARTIQNNHQGESDD